VKVKTKNSRKAILFVLAAVVATSALTAGVNLTGQTDVAQAYDALCVSDTCHKAADEEAAAEKRLAQAASNQDAYQKQVDIYSAQIAQIQAQINQNNAEISQLNVQIKAAQQRLDTLKELLAKTIKQLYLDNNVSALDILASSHSISDFVSKQASSSSLQGKAKTLADQVSATKSKLEQDKTVAENKKSANEAAKKTAAQQQAEQQAYVNKYAKDKAAASADAKAAQKTREEEMNKQRELIASQTGGKTVAGDPNKGGYPGSATCPAMHDQGNAPTMPPGTGENCECYSYGMWKIYQYIGYYPSNLLYKNGPKDFYGLSGTKGGGTTPRAHSAGIMTGGYYGHIVWVESVNSNGTVNVSQYNATPWQYSEQYGVSPYAYQWYLYF
jgi:peptidoglycan hydrolase CwlO-like protein